MREFLASLEWLSLIECIATALMAIVACMALNTWKQQSKAEKKADFLDKLTDEIHRYIQEMSAPVEMLKIIQIGLDCHTALPCDEFKNNPHANSIAYIEKRGKSDSVKLFEYLNKCNESMAIIQSLMVKGQIYNLNKYNECLDSCKMLLWQHSRLQVVALVIGSDSMNWENHEVQKSITNIHSVSLEDVRNHLQEHHVKYLEFAKKNYHAIY